MNVASLLTPNKIFIRKHALTFLLLFVWSVSHYSCQAANECIAQDFSVTPTVGSIKLVLKDVSAECCMKFWDNEGLLEHRFLSQLEFTAFFSCLWIAKVTIIPNRGNIRPQLNQFTC